MKKIYIAPNMADNSVYLINGIADINLGSGAGGDGVINDPPGDGEYTGGAKERYNDDVVYGNIW